MPSEEIRELSQHLAPPVVALARRQGVVQSVEAGSVTITLGGSTTSISGVKHLGSYAPVAGETVWLLADGPDLLVLGSQTATNPRGTLGHVKVTTGQSGITTDTDLTGLSVTVNVQAGRRLKISLQALVYGTVAGDRAHILIREGTTVLDAGTVRINAVTTVETLYAFAIVTPSAGSHTYKLTLGRAVGSGTVATDASVNVPVHILVEDIGSA